MILYDALFLIVTHHVSGLSVESLSRCRVCSGVCAECENSSTLCTACREEQFLLKETCMNIRDPCPAGRYIV